MRKAKIPLKGLAAILLLVCLALLLAWQGSRQVDEEIESSDRRATKRRRLKRRGGGSGGGVAAALAQMHAPHLLFLAAVSLGSSTGYWSLPRSKEFSELVHTTWSDSRF